MGTPVRLATLAFATLLALIVPAIADDGDAPLATVDTLAVDLELTSRGRLGGVAADRIGFVYVSNFGDSVWRIDPDGHAVLLTDSLYGSSGNAIDSHGDLLQANFYANTVVRIRRTGEIELVSDQGLAGPVGIAVDAEDNLFVCNCNDNSIARIDADGVTTRFATSPEFMCPNGITFDDRDNLYVVSFASDHVVRIGADGTAERIATVATGGGNAHIAFAGGALYVTKIKTNDLYRVNLDGSVFAVAGTGEVGLSDGPGPEATMARPNGIAAAPGGGTLFVNNLDGGWRSNARTSMVLRRVHLTMLRDVMSAAFESGGDEAVTAAYLDYHAHPARAASSTEREAIAYGVGMFATAPEHAVLVLRLNAERYPDSANAAFRLGQAYGTARDFGAARAQFERALELDPEHAGARNAMTRFQQ